MMPPIYDRGPPNPTYYQTAKKSVQSFFRGAYRSITNCFRADDISTVYREKGPKPRKEASPPLKHVVLREPSEISESSEDPIHFNLRDLPENPAPPPKEHVFTVRTKFEQTLDKIRDGMLKNRRPSVNKGACESRTYFDQTGKGVGIFKDLEPRDLSFKRTLEIAFKRFFNIRRPTELLPGGDPRSKAFAEKMAYDLDRQFGFNIVPETNFTHRPGNEDHALVGTLQVFVENHKDASVEFITPRHAQPTHAELKIFQMLPIFDYLIGGVDCHFDNFMVELDSEGRLKSIANIDNGNAFIEQNPNSSDKTILKNQYRWGEHPYSKALFSSDMEAFVRGIDETKLRAFFESKREELSKHSNPNVSAHADTFFSEAMISNTVERLAILKKMVRGYHSPSELAKIKTDSQIEKILPKEKKEAAHLLTDPAWKVAGENLTFCALVDSKPEHLIDLLTVHIKELDRRIGICHDQRLKGATESLLKERKKACRKAIRNLDGLYLTV